MLPRYERIARWYAAHMQQQRGTFTALHAEVGGKKEIALDARTVGLACRADAIEQRPDGSFAILDYKTGQIPGKREIAIGLAPLLGLTGLARNVAIAEAATPTAVTSALMAIEFEGDADYVTSVIFFSTLFSALTLTAVLWYLG